MGLLTSKFLDRLDNITWIDLITTWSTPPTLVATIAEGEVWSYTFNLTTRYRLVPIPYNPNNDTFYGVFQSNTLSSPIVARSVPIS